MEIDNSKIKRKIIQETKAIKIILKIPFKITEENHHREIMDKETSLKFTSTIQEEMMMMMILSSTKEM